MKTQQNDFSGASALQIMLAALVLSVVAISVTSLFAAPRLEKPEPQTSAPTPTPQAGRIVFSRYPYSFVPGTTPTPTPFEERYDIYAMDSNGANLVRLTFAGPEITDKTQPKWSFDEYKIVYVETRLGGPFPNPSYIRVLGLGGDPLGEGSNPAWSPDGTKITFNFAGNIWVMNANGSNRTDLKQEGFNPSWSPDGTKISFMRIGVGIWVMNADGTNPIGIQQGGGDPEWSPDGTKIAFRSNGDIWVMNADGTNPTRLTIDPAEDFWPSWSAGGLKIVFESFRDGHSQIYTMDADGSNQTRISSNMFPDRQPDWQRDGFVPTPTPTPSTVCGTFSNPGTITIPATGSGGISSPYPSEIVVSGVGGGITKVTVALNGITHSSTADLDVLLVGPGGHNATILSDVGGSNAATGVNLVLDDAAASSLPVGFFGGVLVNGTFRPTNNAECSPGVDAIDLFPAPAPSPFQAGSALSAFNRLNPNGTWKLYVVDDRGTGDIGSFAGGWAITVATDNCAGPTATPMPTPTPGGATHFSVVAPDSVSGDFQFTVTARNEAGNIVTDYAGTIHFSTEAFPASLPPDSGLTNGTGTFTANFAPFPFGGYAITATDVAHPGITGTSNCFTAQKITPTPPPTPTPTVTPVSHIILLSRLSDARAYARASTISDPPPQSQTDFLPAALSNSASALAAKGGTGASANSTSNSAIVLDGSMDTLQVTGNGVARARAWVQGSEANAGAKLIVLDFTVTDSFAYFLTGELFAAWKCCHPSTVAATARLTTATSTIFEAVADSSHPSVTLSENGTLPPGSYTLSVDLSVEALPLGGSPPELSSGGNFTFALGPAPTPTPTPTPPPNCEATSFEVITPETGTAGVPFSFQVRALCNSGFPAAAYFGSVHFTSSDPAAELVDGTLSGGFGSFSATLHTGGSQTITATDSSQASLTGTSNPIVILAPSPTATATATPTPGGTTQALNLSTRLLVGTGDDVGIGGFIITGTSPKQLLLRGIGPSLGNFGVPNPLADPMLELHGPGTFVTIPNNNWKDTQQAAIEATGIPPTNDLESAILVTLDPGAYTAILRGNNNGTGVGLVELYDLSQGTSSKLANISTRGFVSTGGDIVIAGFILGGGSSNEVILVRGLGPSLTQSGVPNVLADPRLELRNSDGGVIALNYDWQDGLPVSLPPTDPLEAAIERTLSPGAYTALLSGVNDGTGVGLIEIYDRGPATPTPTPIPIHLLPCDSVEKFDNVPAPALPAGWVAANSVGAGPLWITSTSIPDTAPNNVFVADPPTVSDKHLDTPDITIAADATNDRVSFHHSYALDPVDGGADFFDGGVLEVSSPNIAGGAFTDITSPLVGGSFVTGGYNGMISTAFSSPIGGRMAWSQSSNGYIVTTANLGPNVAGQTIKLRFRMCSDSRVSGLGWRIDTVQVLRGTCIKPTPPPCTTVFSETFDKLVPTPTPTPPAFPGWVISTLDPDTPPNVAFCSNPPFTSDSALDFVVSLPSTRAVLRFRNNFNLEANDGIFWDGGVLEVSSPNISGGDFLDITDPAVGGSFVSGGYTGEITDDDSNPLAGRLAWSGDSNGYIDTVVNLGPNLSGQTITLRFRLGTDSAVGAPGWRVDSITITTCGNRP